MENPVHHVYHLLIFLSILLLLHPSTQLLHPSQYSAILTIHRILNYPLPLTPDFCNNTDLTVPSLTLVCYEETLTQLHITCTHEPCFLQNISTYSLFSAIASISSLKVLSLVSLGLNGPMPDSIAQLSQLEILNVSSNNLSGPISVKLSFLRNLQTLILDDNNFTGHIPDWISSFPVLSVLSLKNNSLTGSLPNSVRMMGNLRILALSGNQLFGTVVDLSTLKNLQIIDLGANKFGPKFPSLPHKLVTLVLRNNMFKYGISAELVSYYQLQKLDISLNQFVGPFFPPLLSLPSLNYLDIGGNKLTGMLWKNMSCGDNLAFVNVSSNLLTGDLPSCLEMESSGRVVLYGENCLSNDKKEQHPSNFCHNEAMAVNVTPHEQKQRRPCSKAVIGSSAVGGILGGIALFGLIFFFMKKVYSNNGEKLSQSRSIVEKVSAVNEVKLLSDARYISQTMKLGSNLPMYRTFSIEELKEATNNFVASSFIREATQGQLYGGKLPDDTLIAIKSLKLRKKNILHSYTQHIELISKLRHSHLASALGHCLESCDDDSSFNRMHLVFEFFSNGTLRDCISGLCGPNLNWKQRIAAAIGVAKGILFLHEGVVPGLFSNNLKITDVLMDDNVHVKISCYNLTLLSENIESVDIVDSSAAPKRGMNVGRRPKLEDRTDVYDFGVILLEIILGRPIISRNEVTVAKDLLRVSMGVDDMARKSIVDPVVEKECSDESLKTMMDICLRCLSDEVNDRPSFEDVIWTLQFAAQVQDLPLVISSHSTPQAF